MSKREDPVKFDLPEVEKSPLDPYMYKCIILKNKLRVMLISINDSPEKHAQKPANEDGELNIIKEFNAAYTDKKDNLTAHKLMTGFDVWKENVAAKSNRNGCIQGTTDKRKKPKKPVRSSTHKTFSGAVAVVVSVGDISDPEEVHGMAHLCEHSVLLGSKKFPKPDEFLGNARVLGTEANASTSFFATDFFASTKSKEEFLETLDYMSDYLVNPLLDDKRVKAEVEAVDCEFRMRQGRASIGLLQILRNFYHKDHPMHKFTCGNLSTLRDPKLGAKLREWKAKYYVGNLMTMTLVATLPISELEDLAVQYFSKVKEGSSCEKVPWSVVQGSNPKCTPQFTNFFRVHTDRNNRDLVINFALPADIWKQVGTRPIRLISFLLTDRGPNGLRTYLNRNGFSVDFYAGALERDWCQTEFNTLLSILIILSQRGFENYEIVLEAVFSYIRMLNSNLPFNRFFEEMKKYHQQKFHYSHQTNNTFSRRAKARAVKTSHLMQGIRPWKILTTDTLMVQYNEDLVQRVLKQMIPENVNIMLTSKCYAEIAKTVEPLYQHRYQQENISDDLMDHLRNSDIKFELPAPNPYLNLKFGRFSSTPPKYVRPSDITNVGQKAVIVCAQVVEPQHGLLAKTKCAMFIQSKVMEFWEPTQLGIILDLMAYHLEIELNLKHKPASGSFVKINTGKRGNSLAIFLHSPSQFLVSVFEDIFKTFFQFEKNIHEYAFKAKKSRIIESFSDSWMDDLSYCEAISEYIFNGNFVDYPILKHRLNDLQLATFVTQIDEFREKFLLTVALEGCVEQFQVDELANVINTWKNGVYLLETKKDPPAAYICDSSRVMLMQGERVLRVLGKLPTSEVSTVKNYFQLEPSVDIGLVEKLVGVLGADIFYDLRTDQQLGYHVKANFTSILGVPIIGLEVITRTRYYAVGYISERIHNFVSKFYYDHLRCQRNFSKRFIKTNLTWKSVKYIFETYLLPTGKGYRSLSIQVCGPIEAPHAKEASITAHKMGNLLLETNSSSLGQVTLVASEKSKRKGVDEEKYFILNVDQYKNSLPQFSIAQDSCQEVPSPFEDAGGETSEEEE